MFVLFVLIFLALCCLLAEDQAVSYELYKDERRGKTSAVDLKIL